MRNLIIKTFTISIVLIISLFAFALNDNEEIENYYKATYEIPASLNISKVESTAEVAVSNSICDGLFTVGNNFELKPQLIKHWDSNKDKLKYRFILKEKIYFHDGSAITSESIKIALELLKENRRDDPIYRNIKEIKILNDYSVQVSLYAVNSLFLTALASPHAKVYKIDKNYKAYPICSGPFKFKKLLNNELRLERFEGYYDTIPKIKNLIFVKIDEKEINKSLHGGKIFDNALYPDTAAQSKSLNERTSIASTIGSQTWFIALNNAEEPFLNKRLRKCLSIKFDKHKFIKKFVPSHSVAKNFLPPSLLNDQLGENIDSSNLNCLFKAQEVSLLYPNELSDGAEMCSYFSAQFNKLNLKLKCDGIAFADLLGRIKSKKYQAAFLSHTLDFPDISYFYQFFYSKNELNYANIKSDNYDQKYLSLISSLDRVNKFSIYKELNKFLMNESVILNLSHPLQMSRWNKCLSGVKLNPAGEAYIDYRLIFKKKECSFDN